VRLSIFLFACLIAWATHEWGDEKPLPDGWRWTSMRSDTANCSAFADKRPTFTAERPVSIRCTSESPGYAAARFNFPVDALRGKRAGLFADVRVENVSKGSRLWLRVDRPGQFGAASDDMENRPLIGTSEWVTVAVQVDVPSDASTLFGGIALEGSGKISVTNIRLEAVSTNFEMESNTNTAPTEPSRMKDKK
jgi:hypothetical protein